MCSREKYNSELEEFKNSFEEGIKVIKECFGTLKSENKILSGTGYIMAMMTDKFDLQYIEDENFNREELFHKALEIRIFNERGEIKWFRGSIDKPLQSRRKLDFPEWGIFRKSENYWDERQYLDIDDMKDVIEGHKVTAIGGGRYPLPIKPDGVKKDLYKDLQIVVRNYIDYEKDTMQLFISDWRLVGFTYEETVVETK